MPYILVRAERNVIVFKLKSVMKISCQESFFLACLLIVTKYCMLLFFPMSHVFDFAFVAQVVAIIVGSDHNDDDELFLWYG